MSILYFLKASKSALLYIFNVLSLVLFEIFYFCLPDHLFFPLNILSFLYLFFLPLAPASAFRYNSSMFHPSHFRSQKGYSHLKETVLYFLRKNTANRSARRSSHPYGIRIRNIAPEQVQEQVGALAGAAGFEKSGAASTADPEALESFRRRCLSCVIFQRHGWMHSAGHAPFRYPDRP